MPISLEGASLKYYSYSAFILRYGSDFKGFKVRKVLEDKGPDMTFLISSWKRVGSLPVYPINEKSVCHAFIGPEGQ